MTRGVLEINPSSFDDTELGGFCRDALVQGKVVVNPEARCQHGGEEALCVACGDEGTPAAIVDGTFVSLHIRTGLGSGVDIEVARHASQAISNALAA